MRLLAVGVYLTDHPSEVLPVTQHLRSATTVDVDVRWAAVGASPPPRAMTGLTAVHTAEPTPKFELLRRLLRHVQLDDYDAVLVIDDDVELGPDWLDTFVALQLEAGFALAQPARTADSHIDHPLTQQLAGVRFRSTRFVEIGPAFCVLRPAFDLVLSFDTRWPMGWGLDYVWPRELESAGLAMGIVDGAPVRHRLRRPQATYSAAATRQQMQELLAAHPHLDRREAQVVTSLTTTSGAVVTPRRGTEPQISVVINTRNRAPYLQRALAALVAQTLPRDQFEVVVVDDGSSDATVQVVERFADMLPLRPVTLPPSGIAAARNVGIWLARAPVVLFLDDDDVADARLLEVHVEEHRRLGPDVAVLGYTGLTVDVQRSFLMRYVTGVGHHLFSYAARRPGLASFAEFWGGRTSVTRHTLVTGGVFDPQFTFGAEDLELAYRLHRLGLRVYYVPEAKSWMTRALTVPQFAARSRRQGRSDALFLRKHRDLPALRHILSEEQQSRGLRLLGRQDELEEHVVELTGFADQWRAAGFALPGRFVREVGRMIDDLHAANLMQGFTSIETQSRLGEFGQRYPAVDLRARTSLLSGRTR